MWKTIVLAAILPALCISGQSLPSLGQDFLVLTHISTIDVKAGMARSGMYVVVAGNRISEVGQAEQVPVADPLDDIHNTQQINAAIENGRLLDRKALDKMLGQS